VAELRQWLLAPRASLAVRSLRLLLRLLSLPYAAVTALRNWAYDRRILAAVSLQIPVICIGNLTVGGTGKTPMVAWLARWLRARGLRTAIVSRGYGQLASGQNDEALELELRLPDVPHLQNPDRAAACRLAQDELEMEVVVLDDGFQHRRLARDLDIVLIDATDPPTAHWLLPGGLMRESWRGLKRAAVVVITRTRLAGADNVARIERLVARHAPAAICVRSWHEAKSVRGTAQGGISTLAELSGTRVLAFCGIGNPEPYFRMLGENGLRVEAVRTWPDHHAYSSEDVADLNSWAGEHSDCVAVVCTMKDWVKLQIPRLGPLPLLAIEIEVVIDPDNIAALEDKLLKAIGAQAQRKDA
jgi:tetraacyldisaccharide 4'-kinase